MNDITFNRNTFISTVMGTLITTVIGILAIWIAFQQLQLDKEKAERERAEAQSKVEAAQTKFTNTLGTYIEEAKS